MCGVALTAAPASAATDRTSYMSWTSTTQLARGTSKGLTAISGAVTIGPGSWVTTYDDPHVSGGAKSYDTGTWTSPWVSTGYAARTLVPSWAMTAPEGTWARVYVRGRSGSTVGTWDTVARWAQGTSSIKSSSYSSQRDDLTNVAVDTLRANPGKTFTGWQVQVVLLRPVGSTAKPILQSVGGTASSYATRSISTSKTTMTSTKELSVPRYSQMIHKGEYPQWGGGGEAWCSPTSTSMVMRYFKAGPAPSAYAWSPYAESWVDHAARYTYDELYDGTGNWPFNTAYASNYGLDSFVTRLSSLRDAEAFIKAGIPLVASIAFSKGKLTGAPISSTPGHLLVITGITKNGNVIANDPAAPKASTVRRVYTRSQFEKAWLGGSGGVVYVIRPASRPLPKDSARW